MVILPLVIGAITVGFIQILSLQGTVSSGISDSADAQTVSVNLDQDVQSAVQLTTSSAATQCGPGTQLLGLEWNWNQLGGAYQTVVSYVRVPSGTGYSLVREYCASGPSATPTTSNPVSSDISATQAPPAISPSSDAAPAASGWIAAAPITAVTFAITEPGSQTRIRSSASPQLSRPAASNPTFPLQRRAAASPRPERGPTPPPSASWTSRHSPRPPLQAPTVRRCPPPW